MRETLNTALELAGGCVQVREGEPGSPAVDAVIASGPAIYVAATFFMESQLLAFAPVAAVGLLLRAYAHFEAK